MSQDTATNLYTALLAAQKAMGPVKKDASNPAFRSKYATLQSVIETIEEPLHANGLVLVQRLQYDRIGRDGGAGEGTPILITELIHAASGEKLDSHVPVVCKDPLDPQKVGGALTYFRRYSLLALLNLAPEDDDGNVAAQPRPAQRPQTAPPARTAPQSPSAPRPAAALVAAGPPSQTDEQLLATIRNVNAAGDDRWNALWDYYERATTVAELNQRADIAYESGMETRDLKAAYRQQHERLSKALAPAGIAG